MEVLGLFRPCFLLRKCRGGVRAKVRRGLSVVTPQQFITFKIHATLMSCQRNRSNVLIQLLHGAFKLTVSVLTTCSLISLRK